MSSEILIIGAGAAGLSTGLELAQRGLRVAILERGRAGGESTWAGGGILSPLLPWHYDERVNRLSEYSRSLLPEWVERLQSLSGQEAEWLDSGMLVLPPYDCDAAKSWCDAHAWPWSLRPAQDFLPRTGTWDALWLPGVSQVRNPALIRVLRGAVQAAGVRLVEDAEVQGLTVSGGRVTGVASTQGRFQADAVVLTAGAWSGSLSGLDALARRVYPVRGQMLLFKLDPGALRCIVFKDGRYLIPRRDGHVLAGSTLEEVGFDKSTTTMAREDILAFAGGLLPGLNRSTLTMHWSGLRPGSPDNVPVIGRYPGLDNLFLNTGHYRYGVTMAPGSARLLASLLLAEAAPVDPDPYGLEAVAGA